MSIPLEKKHQYLKALVGRLKERLNTLPYKEYMLDVVEMGLLLETLDEFYQWEKDQKEFLQTPIGRYCENLKYEALRLHKKSKYLENLVLENMTTSQTLTIIDTYKEGIDKQK